MANIVNIIPAKNLYVIIVTVSMLAFGLKPQYAEVQIYTAASMAVLVLFNWILSQFNTNVCKDEIYKSQILSFPPFVCVL